MAIPSYVKELLDELATMKFETTSSSGGIDEVDLDTKLDDWIFKIENALASFKWVN